jgi:uncharacterized membrane protein (UPF0127 family)
MRAMKSCSKIEIWNESQSTCVCRAARVADTSLSRFAGLLGRRSLPEEGGLLIRPSSGVHTWGMSMRIDILALDGEDRVWAAYENVGPWHLRGISLRTKSVLELPAGRIARCGVAVGDQLKVRHVRTDAATDERSARE